MYDYINNIDTTDRVIYSIIIIITIVLTTRFAKLGVLTNKGMIGIVFGVIVVFYLNEKRIHRGEAFIEEMQKTLDSEIMKPHRNHYLAYNAELVAFLDDYMEYYNYNPAQWNQLVSGINNFLKIVHQIELGTALYNLDYDVLKGLHKKILNTFHSFIHMLPHTENSNNKFHLGMERLEKLLNLDIDKVHTVVTKRNSKGVDTSTIFHYKNHPTPAGNARDHHYGFHV